MAIYYPNLEQGSPEWHALRNRPTASRFSDLVTSQGKPSASAGPYIAEILSAHFGQYKQSYYSDEMQRGHDEEGAGRLHYEILTGNTVTQTGFVIERDEPFAPGCSPDGLVGDDGGIEMKHPDADNHMLCFLNGTPKKHIPQIQGFLFVTGRKWCDFVSRCTGTYNEAGEFVPLPEKFQIFIQRQHRDAKYIAALDAATSNAQAILRKLTGV